MTDALGSGVVPMHKATILVACSHKNMAGLVAASLRSIGVREILKASDSNAINEILHGRPISGAVIDLDLGPEATVELVVRLRRERGPNAHIPIIALTGGTTRAVLDGARTAGIDRIVTKPVSAQTLSEAFRTLESARRAGRADEPRDSIGPVGDSFLEI